MTRGLLLRAFLSHYRRHPLQLAALALIILLATGLWSGVWDLTRQARSSLEQGNQVLSGFSEISRANGDPVTVDDFVRLRRAGLCVIPWLNVEADGDRGQIIGIDSVSLGCFAGRAQGKRSLDRFRGEPFVDIGQAASRAQSSGSDSRLRLMAPTDVGSLPQGYRTAPAERRLDTGELADSFLLNLDALCVLVLLITGLLVRSVYLLGQSQRRASFMLLRRFGVRPSRIRRFLVVELAVITVVAALPGTLLGLMLAQGFAVGFERALGGLFDVTLFSQSLSWMSIVPVLVMTLLVLLWCLVSPAGSRPRRGKSYLLPGAALLLGIATLWVYGSSSLLQVFLALALLFLAVGVLTPGLIAGVLARLSRSRHAGQPLQRWSLRELSVMVRRLGLPVVALQFAAATVLAIQALVTTFEATFYDWLDQRLQGDIYMEWPIDANLERLAPTLRSLEAVDAWHPVTRGEATLQQPQQSRVDLLALEPSSPLLQDWTFLAAVDTPWHAVADGQVMINEQLARRHGLKPGDALGVTLSGSTQQRVIAAIYADYGRPSGEVLIAAKLLPPNFRPSFVSLTLDLKPSADIGKVSRTLQTAVPDLALHIRNNDSVRGLATRVFHQTFLLTQAISLLTLVLAGMALLVLGWVFFATRRWYFHLLRVWGLSAGELRRLVARLSVGLTLLSALAALPLGVLLTWVLVARINPLAFGWSLPMAVYPLFWIQLLGVAVGIGLIIAWLIQRQLGDTAPDPVTMDQLAGEER
ncbi:ABC transporter permease [Marinobacter fonticola]|uniref:ABC transporter permease n=1 Tax=Marinobacter fonticola TaxID=2603215 RepID=UPI001D0D8730|nr:ABC transporter permease [Marinobacter fonticola]